MATGILAKGPVNSPKWVFFLRIAIIVFTVLVLALSAWNVHLTNNPFSSTSSSGSSSSGSSGADISGICAYYGVSCKRYVYGYSGYTYYTAAPALMIFAVIFSLLTHCAVYGFEKWMPHMFFRICVFIAYILVAIFLLSGWAYLASVAAIYGPYVDQVRKLYPNGSEGNYMVQLGASAAAAAALGAVLWVLVVINTVMFTLACFRTEGESMTTGATELHQVGKAETSVHVAPAGVAAPVYYASPTPQPQVQPYGVPPQQPYQQGYVVQQQVPTQ